MSRYNRTAVVIGVNRVSAFYRNRTARIPVKFAAFSKQKPVSVAVNVHHVAFLYCRNYHNKNTPFVAFVFPATTGVYHNLSDHFRTLKTIL